MKVGVVGCGSIGRRHVWNLLIHGVEPHVYDLAGGTPPLGARAHKTLTSLMRSTPDAWMVCTPWDQHEQVVLQVLETQAPVFVEKPLSHSAASARALAERAGNQITMVACNMRFHRDVQGFFVQPASAITVWRCDTNMEWWPGRAYGPPWLECIHEVDLALYRHGAVESIESAQMTDVGGHIIMRHTSGVRSAISLRVDADDPQRGVWTAEPPRYRAWDMSPTMGEAMYRDMLSHFLYCVETEIQTCCPFSDGVAAIELVERAAGAV